jgi:hypothetical protein
MLHGRKLCTDTLSSGPLGPQTFHIVWQFDALQLSSNLHEIFKMHMEPTIGGRCHTSGHQGLTMELHDHK